MEAELVEELGLFWNTLWAAGLALAAYFVFV